jgi:hypothetical protein
MKVLIAIMSWVGGCRKGVHKAQRATFLQDVAKFPGLDYKIFVGDGTGTGEDEYDVNKSFEAAHPLTQGKNSKNQPKSHFDYVPNSDEVVLHIPDGLVHIAYKARAAWQWAFNNDYDYVFACFCDTYVDVERLMHSGFENHDFIGMTYDENRCPQGGAGYWLSRRCLEALSTAHVDFWADDGWAGWTLPKYGIHLHHDPRYGQYPDSVPTKQNDIITSHLGQHPYKTMRDIHAGTWNGPAVNGKVYVEWYELQQCAQGEVAK